MHLTYFFFTLCQRMCKPYIVVARAVVTMTSENRYLQKRNRVLFLDLMIIACSWLKCHRDLQTGTLCMNDTRVRCAHEVRLDICVQFFQRLPFIYFFLIVVPSFLNILISMNSEVRATRMPPSESS